MKPFKKLLSWKLVFLLVAFLCSLSVGYLVLDWKNIQIDRYNFEQLEKAKPILESIPVDAPKFYSLKKFNELYKADIKPIVNCYSVSNSNGSENYKFGFKLESLIYRFLYRTQYYVYPKYNLPVSPICTMGGGCKDMNKDNLIHTISNPCEE